MKNKKYLLIKLLGLSLITSISLITLNAATIEPITNWTKYPLP